MAPVPRRVAEPPREREETFVLARGENGAADYGGFLDLSVVLISCPAFAFFIGVGCDLPPGLEEITVESSYASRSQSVIGDSTSSRCLM